MRPVVNSSRIFRSLRAVYLAAAAITLLCTAGMAQDATATNAKPGASPSSPAIRDIKGVGIGMTAAEVKKKVGRPDLEDDTGLLFTPGDGVNMQVRLDSEKKVSSVAVIFMGAGAKAPEYNEVFGPNVAVEKTDDGRIYNIIRYPDAGIWIAYSRSMVKDKPMTSVTITKMP